MDVSVGGNVAVGVQVASYPMGVQVAVGGGGTSVFGAKGFMLEAGLLAKLKNKKTAPTDNKSIKTVNTFQSKSRLGLFFEADFLGFPLRKSSYLLLIGPSFLCQQVYGARTMVLCWRRVISQLLMAWV